ncbi:MAG: T9SS type A sorting domain-containing protein, partial [Saprospiraceae bacterium]|nr:T9SS type A sorting domain-containing protein [Saprospiraceae bacterium]
FITYSIESNSQIIITEINYNPPETGQDTLEYIEFHNTSLSTISIKDWVINDAVGIVFPDTTIKANGYLVICNNANAFESTYGFKAIQWENGALLNSGELISLKDNSGTIIDSVRFSDTNGWPTDPDGNGSSLELCRITVDNSLSEYWKSATRLIGIVINSKELRGSPGIANNVACADVTIDVMDFSFKPANIEILIGQHVEWKNISGRHNVNGRTLTFPNNPEDFYSGTPMTGNWTYIKRFDKEGNYDYRDDLNTSSMTGKIKVKKLDPLFPTYPVGLITTVKSDGVADSLNVRCSLEGIVHGINFRPSGLQFTLMDDFSDGINVFSTSTNLGYTVTEGDKIRVKGIIAQFNGLLEIIPDSLTILATNQQLKNIINVTALNENTESQFIRIRNVSLLNPVQWTKNPIGFTVKVTDGTNNFDVRIDNDCDLVSKDAPAGKFDITGIGYQNDGTSPFTEGYLLYPRYTSDINPYIPSNKFYQKLDISKARSIKTSGELDSLNVRCELRGIVYGIDYDGGPGLQFTIIDNTAGITVFNTGKILNYKPTEGDEIIVQGRIDQFNGQAEILPDTIILVKEKNTLKNPRTVNLLDESTESDLIRLVDYTISDISEWKGNGSSFNVRIINGMNNYIMRIDDNTDLSNTMPGGNKVTVIGLGNQFDQSLPYTEGYQIWPRYKSDVSFTTDIDNESVQKDLAIIPNPSQNYFTILNEKHRYSNIEIYNTDGILCDTQVYQKTISHTLKPGLYFLRLLHENGHDTIKFLTQP